MADLKVQTDRPPISLWDRWSDFWQSLRRRCFHRHSVRAFLRDEAGRPIRTVMSCPDCGYESKGLE
jgi:hypothetical protein